MKQKICKICNKKFQPTRQLQPTCTNPKCIREYQNVHLKSNKPLRSKRGGFGFKKSKPKIKRGEIIDEEYLQWVGTQPCIITGFKAQRGIGYDDMHVHHINSRNLGRNDHLVISLIGYLHSWGSLAYHSLGEDEYKAVLKARYGVIVSGTVKEFFTKKALELREKYIREAR